MKIRALLILWLIALCALAMCGARVPDVGLSGANRMAMGLRSGVGSGSAGDVETIRIVSRDKLFPNKGARAAGYMTAEDTVGAIINQGTAGQAVKWGHGFKGSGATVYYDGTAPYQSYIMRSANILTEDDEVFQSTNYVGFIWVSANGLKAGHKVESAALIINTAAYEDFVIPAGEYFTVRLDTVSTDYAMASTSVSVYGADTDTARMDISYNEVNASGNVNWSPTLDSRDDRHDFGPRANNVIGAGTYVGGTSLLLNVTDAVQQALDNAVGRPWIITRGFIFHLYASNGVTDEPRFSAGDYEPYIAVGKGCPTFRAHTTSRRGPQPWGGVRVPIVMVFDDSYNMQTEYYKAMHDSGLTFDAAIFRDGMNGHGWVDSLDATSPTDVNYVMHSRTHASIGGLTGAGLDPELARVWIAEQFTAAKDTTSLIDFAWPAGGGTPNTSLEAASRMVDYGYRSSRGTGVNWTATEVAVSHDTWLSWDGFVNVYFIGSPSASELFEVAGAEANASQMADNFGDLVDMAVTDYGRSPVILYGHNYAIDHITATNLRAFIGMVNAKPYTRFMGYKNALSMRINGSTFLDPGAISEWTSAGVYAPVMRGINADSNKIQTMAAQQDSAYEAVANPNLLQMWIGPK